MDGEYDLNNVCLSIPVVVNRHGADRLIYLSLNDEESVALHASAEAIKRIQNQVGLDRLG